MLNLEKIANTTSESLKKKIHIIKAYIDGEGISSICKEYGVYSVSVSQLIKAYESGDEHTFRRSKIGINKEPLKSRYLTLPMKRELNDEINTTNDNNLKKRCLAVFRARDFTSYRKLGKNIGMLDHKQAIAAIERYQKYGIEGLRRKRTGPVPRSTKEIQMEISKLVEMAEKQWSINGKKGFITDAQIAQKAGVSEPTVQQLLRGRNYPWRRPAKITMIDVCKIATKLGQKVENTNMDSLIKAMDKITLICNRCGNKRRILVNTLRHYKPNCPICVRKVPKDKRNKTQVFIVNLIGAILCAKFNEDVTPPFIRKFTGRNFRVDGYSEELKIIIEYQGILHEKPAKLPGLENDERAWQKHNETVEGDRIKRKACKEHGFILIEVNEINKPSLKLAVPKIIAAFEKAGLKVPTQKEIEFAYYNSPNLSTSKISDTKKQNCIERILNERSSIMMESKKMGVHRTTLYRWLRD